MVCRLTTAKYLYKLNPYIGFSNPYICQPYPTKQKVVLNFLDSGELQGNILTEIVSISVGKKHHVHCKIGTMSGYYKLFEILARPLCVDFQQD